MKIFNERFENIGASHRQDLKTLEKEGAVYAQFYRESIDDFRLCRIDFRPSEIYEYVTAARFYDRFIGALNHTDDRKRALTSTANEKIQERVLQYNEWARSIGQSTEYCFAAFLGSHLEDLVCGGKPERYEFLSGRPRDFDHSFLVEILESIPESVDHLKNSSSEAFRLNCEKDIHDYLFSILKSIFRDARCEEYTRKHAGSSKRIDIVVPSIETVIEVKYVRDAAHAKRVADELRVDFESYHIHQGCRRLIAFVWDENRLLPDRHNFIQDLRGIREKEGSKFMVDVIVKP